MEGTQLVVAFLLLDLEGHPGEGAASEAVRTREVEGLRVLSAEDVRHSTWNAK